VGILSANVRVSKTKTVKSTDFYPHIVGISSLCKTVNVGLDMVALAVGLMMAPGV
jgi:hypothetical protein